MKYTALLKQTEVDLYVIIYNKVSKVEHYVTLLKAGRFMTNILMGKIICDNLCVYNTYKCVQTHIYPYKDIFIFIHL